MVCFVCVCHTSRNACPDALPRQRIILVLSVRGQCEHCVFHGKMHFVFAQPHSICLGSPYHFTHCFQLRQRWSISITHNTFFDAERTKPQVILDDDQNHGILLAHYLFFIYWIAHMMVFSIACLFAKLTIWQHDEMINENDGTKFQNIGRFATFLVPTLSWYITRYQYYFCLNLLFLNLTMLGSSIAYFYSLLKSGDR